MLKNRLKVPSLAVMLSALWVLQAIPHGFAGDPEPPTGSEQLHGPAIVGTATFRDDTGKVTFIGNCRGNPVQFEGSLAAFGVTDVSQVTPQRLEGFRPGVSTTDARLGDCYHTGQKFILGELIINTVTRFTNNGDVASADLVVMAVVPR